jgi:hypothetical protein
MQFQAVLERNRPLNVNLELQREDFVLRKRLDADRV